MSPITLYRLLKAALLAPAAALGLPPHACRLTPSCSHYCEQSLDRFGLLKGAWLCLTRLLRCGPWTKPGPDPVPGR